MFQSYKPPPKPASERPGMLPSFEQLDKRRRFHYREMLARGGWRIRVVFYLILVVILVVIAAPTAEAYGYTQLQTSFQTQQCYPVISTSVQSVASTILDTFEGDLLAAAADIITGLNVQGVITLSNLSFVPLYIPGANNKVAIEGKESQNVVWIGGMWIAPTGRKSQAISFRVSIHDLPEAVLRTLANGGTIDIEVISEVPFGPFSITKTTSVLTSISQPLASYME